MSNLAVLVRPPVRNITVDEWATLMNKAATQLNVKVHNFVVQASKTALKHFQDNIKNASYDKEHWAPWQGKYNGDGRTALLGGTDGTLYDALGEEKNTKKKHARKVFSRLSMLERNRGTREGFSGYRLAGATFAAVHNNLGDPKIPPPVHGPKKRRQYIGFTPTLKLELEGLLPKLLEAFIL